MLAFTAVRLLTCCQCNFLRSLFICKWEQMNSHSLLMSWNMEAACKIKDLFCLSQQSCRDQLHPPSSKDIPTQSQKKCTDLPGTAVFIPKSSSYKPTPNRTSKNISQKELLFSYFFLSAVDVFQRKIVMYRLSPLNAGNGSSKCN